MKSACKCCTLPEYEISPHHPHRTTVRIARRARHAHIVYSLPGAFVCVCVRHCTTYTHQDVQFIYSRISSHAKRKMKGWPRRIYCTAGTDIAIFSKKDYILYGKFLFPSYKIFQFLLFIVAQREHQPHHTLTRMAHTRTRIHISFTFSSTGASHLHFYSLRYVFN